MKKLQKALTNYAKNVKKQFKKNKNTIIARIKHA